MYCVQYAKHLISKQIPKEFEQDAFKLIDTVPSNGIINDFDESVCSFLSVSKEKCNALIKLMSTTKLPILKIRNTDLIFDYPENEVEHFRHVVNAINNLGLFDLD